MIYQAEKNLKEFADKIDESDKNAVDSAKEELQNALAGSDVAEIESKTEALAQAMHTFTSKMYQQANPEPGEDAAADDVIDADYNIPEDENDKK